MYRIKEILEEKGISAKSLAERMGVTPQYISGIIREKGSASVGVLSNIAKELGVPLSSLFDDYKKTPSNSSINLTCPHCGQKIELEAKVVEKGDVETV